MTPDPPLYRLAPIPGHPGVIGEYIAGVGDLNADGFDDVAIGVNVAAPGDWVGVIFGGPDVPPPEAASAWKTSTGKTASALFAGMVRRAHHRESIPPATSTTTESTTTASNARGV